jgi:hypothetical protein
MWLMAFSGINPTNVFFDTQVFEQLQFFFDSQHIRQITNLVKEGYIKVYLTTITKREIISHIEKKVSEAFGHLSKFRQTSSVLRNIEELEKLFNPPNIEEAQLKVKARFEELCKEWNVTIIDILKVCPERLFDDYFLLKPPFEGKTDKKAEFPDAFAVAALEQWCNKNNKRMLVVTGDKGWAARCVDGTGLEYEERLVGAIARFPDAEMVIEFNKLLKERRSDLHEILEATFLELKYYLQDFEGTVYSVEMIDFRIYESFVTDIGPTGATIEIDCDAYFAADVEFEEPLPPGYFESEFYQGPKRVRGRVRRTVEAVATVNMNYDKDKPESIEFLDCFYNMDDVAIRLVQGGRLDIY